MHPDDTARRRGWNLRGPRPWAPKGEAHYAWKGDAVARPAGRDRARKLYPILGQCERCGEPATDRHHKNDNTADNSPENIEILCRRCHMTVDGRLKKLGEVGKRPRSLTPAAPCVICEKPYKPLRKGRCAACSIYFRKTGRERTPEHRRKP